MPSNVFQLFAAADLEPEGVVQWDDRVTEQRPGVYVVSLGADVHKVGGLREPPLSTAAVTTLLEVRPELTLDGQRPTNAELAERIAAFWLPDETVVYIGLAGTSLRSRVRGYYKTPIGARRPHAGGWFLKTLRNLDELFVHYSRANDPMAAEDAMLRSFCARVAPTTLAKLLDPAHPLPFANLEWPRGVRKAHGIENARGD